MCWRCDLYRCRLVSGFNCAVVQLYFGISLCPPLRRSPVVAVVVLASVQVGFGSRVEGRPHFPRVGENIFFLRTLPWVDS